MAIINHNYKFVALFCPKTASTSLEKLLSNIPGSIVANDNGNRHSPILSVYEHINYNFIELDNYFKFTVIGNPFDQAISDYHYRKLLNKRGVLLEEMTFSEYLKWKYGFIVVANSSRNICFNSNGDTELDFYAKYETLDCDVGHILNKINVPCHDIKLERLNVSVNRTNKNVANYYSAEDVKIIKNMSKEIIQLGDYKLE